MSNSLVSNPLRSGVSMPSPVIGSGTNAEVQTVTREFAEMQSRIYLAKQFPRDPVSSKDKIINACMRPQLAKVAAYTYARGGTNISGPSIRLAEEISSTWGNIKTGWDEIERRSGESVVRTYAWDLETNTCKELKFIVPLFRSTKQGNKPLTDERDIYEHIANHAARRLRQCILSLIPADVVEEAVEACEKTLVEKCKVTPQRINNMISEFGKLGVTKSQIETRIQRKLESVSPAQFLRLGEIFNSIRDGMSEASEWFGEDQEESLKKKLADRSYELVSSETPSPKAVEQENGQK